LVTATGAHYIAAHSVPRMMDYVREAFHIAKDERRPVVLGIPYDLQKVEHMANHPYETSAMYQPKSRAHASRSRCRGRGRRAAGRGKAAIVLGGRGVLWSGARDAVIKLADRCGALPPNTLPARGLFHDQSVRARHHRQLLHGAGPGDVRVRGRRARGRHEPVLLRRWRDFWPKAYKIQLDDAPRGLRDGLKAADLYVKSDALVGIEAILAGLDKKLGVANRQRRRSARKSWRIASRPSQRLDAVRHRAGCWIHARRSGPSTRSFQRTGTSSSAAASGLFNAQMRGRPAERYTTVREFGAVGNGLCYALGLRLRAARAARARSCCSKATAGSCSISRSSRRSSVRDFAS